MKRIYELVIKNHLQENRQMVFIEGARQVGKTTLAKKVIDKNYYLNWDEEKARLLILKGTTAIADFIGLHIPAQNNPIVIFDELHKFSNWQTFLKGFYDVYGEQAHIIVTGSSKLGVYKKGGDSMMGRYFPYRMHPLTLAEVIENFSSLTKEINLPKKISKEQFESLFKFGGFPDPYLKNSSTFWHRWKKTKNTQLFKEDIRELTQIQELSQMEVLGSFLISSIGGQASYSSLANKIKVSIPTITRWLESFESFFYSYRIYPWSNNIPRSLIKEPKIYLWDWSLIEDMGARYENFIANHLLKFCHFWSDLGFGEYELYFIRDKQKKEVDFLVTKNNKPWMLVEAKTSSNQELNSNLKYFQELLNCPFAFQVVLNMKYKEIDCFSYNYPVIVPAKTFLSQLV
ncbi:ATP-binding protein [Rickettsia hoogstraalii]|uniref:ATP-binding protein n=1 Tax=Rickettsia hoogstraalii TaxID=467174 RepID=UPI002254D5A3|nr:ATP-binding protein [Rickettsia hoogstraalii]MCX4084553.1 ATP-binding protein [Rickettsia hoogstraalii]